MSGHEQIGKEELNSLVDIFKKATVFFFAVLKKEIIFLEQKILEQNIAKFLGCKYSVVLQEQPQVFWP